MMAQQVAKRDDRGPTMTLATLRRINHKAWTDWCSRIPGGKEVPTFWTEGRDLRANDGSDTYGNEDSRWTWVPRYGRWECDAK